VVGGGITGGRGKTEKLEERMRSAIGAKRKMIKCFVVEKSVVCPDVCTS
jgi:hypothetical protein